MEQVTLGTIAQLVNGLGTIGVLIWMAYQFQRGEILSRRVYEDLTTRILDVLCARIIKEVRDAMREERSKQDKARQQPRQFDTKGGP